MGKFIDLTGKRFGKWTVIKRVENDKNKNTKFLCKCDCGTIKEVLSDTLRYERSKSCGCSIEENSIKIEGQRFGRLIVIKRIKNNKFLCKCDCGNFKTIEKSSLLSKNTKSCGCLARETSKKTLYKHGFYGTKIYKIYYSMKNRCYYHKNISFSNYGARGIKICKEWLNKENGFLNFYNWAIENGYKEGLSIDRIDVNGNYEPNNCRWVTRAFQNNNKRNNIIIKYNNEEHNLKEWSKILNLDYKRIFNRYKLGKSVEDIFYNSNLKKKGKNKC